MAKNRWLGGAPKVAQVMTFTLATYDVTTTNKITIGNQSISAADSGGTTTTSATALLALLTASTVQQFAEITWTSSGAVITGTAKTAGYNFVATATATGGTGTFTAATTTANSGPNDASVAANWSLTAIPVNGDDIYFDNGNYDVLYGLNQSAVTPNSINILPGYSGKIGLPKTNAVNASATYPEYRPDYLQYGATTIYVNGGGGRLKLDNGSTAVTWNILGTTTQRADNGVPVLLLKGSATTNTLDINKGDCALAWFAGESSGLGTLNIGFESNVNSDVALWLGPDVTFTNTAVVISGGSTTINSSITSTGTVVIYGGKLMTLQSAAIAQLTIWGGTVVYSGSGTLGGNTKVSGTGALDFSQDLRGKTVTNPIEIYSNNCEVLDPNAIINSGAMVIGYNGCQDVGQANFGTNFRLTRSTTP